MAIAFAAFSTTLNITASSSIDSSFKIRITKVVTKNVVGKATSEYAPIFSGTAVTFNTLLYSPSDSLTYEVTVVNEGSLDAKLDSIEMTDSKNPAINFELGNINENDLLESLDEITFDVTVSYNENIISQPNDLSSALTVKLNYVQNA